MYREDGYELQSNRPCPLCDENIPENFRIYFDGYVKLFKCRTCGFVAQYLGPGLFVLKTNYEDSYTLDFIYKGQEFMYPERRVVFQDIVDRISNIKGNSKILDVGCGDGHFLHLCAIKGFECHGVEPSKTLASYAASKTGANVIQAEYKKTLFPENSFDVITFIQVLEHIPTPLALLESAKYHLRPGGILVIEVPSIYAPNFLAYRWTGIKWFVKPPGGIIHCHVNYFSPKTLAKLTEKIGFKQYEIVTGRWKYKYTGLLKCIGIFADPLMNATRVGGILYIGIKG